MGMGWGARAGGACAHSPATRSARAAQHHGLEAAESRLVPRPAQRGVGCRRAPASLPRAAGTEVPLSSGCQTWIPPTFFRAKHNRSLPVALIKQPLRNPREEEFTALQELTGRCNGNSAGGSAGTSPGSSRPWHCSPGPPGSPPPPPSSVSQKRSLSRLQPPLPGSVAWRLARNRGPVAAPASPPATLSAGRLLGWGEEGTSVLPNLLWIC